MKWQVYGMHLDIGQWMVIFKEIHLWFQTVFDFKERQRYGRSTEFPFYF